MNRLAALFAVILTLNVIGPPLSLAENSTSSTLADAYPTITSVRGRVLKVRVPAGYGEVVVERQTARKGRPWVTMQSQICRGDASELTVKLRTAVPRRLLRVAGRRMTTLPAAFLTGRTEFLAGEDPAFNPLTIEDPRLVGPAGVFVANATADASMTTDADASRTVVESDIWKLSGDRLYFFNQYRGLQVLDVSDPQQPALAGTLRVPATGQDLYELPGGYVALLTRGTDWWYSGSGRGEIVICAVGEGRPSRVAALPFTGQLVESRLVGTALYLAANQSSFDGIARTYRQRTVVTGFDLSDPAHPVQRNSVVISPFDQSDYATAVWANDRYFLVASANYAGGYATAVSLVDIANPDGTVALRGEARVAGYVGSKFNLQENAGVLSIISDVWGWQNTGGARLTRLSNFDVRNPQQPLALGSLDVGQGESVRSTRYDGYRVYIVTAIQQDPLWLIDNSNPAKPSLVSHLEVPGWSTYIHPLGDRLVSVGRLTGLDEKGDWRNCVAVSLYDVADPAKPRLLSQLPVGSNWSHSEANLDEKAFTVLPGDGLILLPFNDGWSLSGDSDGGIQIVDLERESLKLRGVIRQGFTPRRSAIHKAHVLALSDRDLLTVDITNRDRPAVKADLELAWIVDRVWNVGQYLLQLDRGQFDAWSGERGRASLTITGAESPEETVGLLDLGDATVIGAEVKNAMLYVAQHEAGFSSSAAPAKSRVRLTAYDLASLPKVVKRGQVLSSPIEFSESAQAQLLWPKPETLVLVVTEPYHFWWGGGVVGPAVISIRPTVDTVVAPGNAFAVTTGDALFAPFPSRSGNGPRTLLAFDLSNGALSFLNQTVLKTSSYDSSSPALADGGLVFIGEDGAGWSDSPVILTFGADGTAVKPVPPAKARGRFRVHVVDYTVPASPVVRPPLNVPGRLQGISRGGQLLYTAGPAYDDGGNPDWKSQRFHAAAYDGIAAHLLDSIAGRNSIEGRLYGEVAVLRQNEEHYDAAGNYVSEASFETWTLSDDGKFHILDREPQTPWSDWNIVGDLLLTRDSTGLHAYDLDFAADLRDLGPLEPGVLYGPPQNGDGDRERGLWFAVGLSGVERVKVP